MHVVRPGRAGGVQLLHPHQNSKPSLSQLNPEAAVQEEIQAVTEEQGPYKLHQSTHTPSLLILYIKHNLKTNYFFYL